MFIVPHMHGGLQGLDSVKIIESPQYPAGGGKGCARQRTVSGVVCEVNAHRSSGIPDMVNSSASSTSRKRVNLAVGLRCGVAQMRVLAGVGFDDARYGVGPQRRTAPAGVEHKSCLICSNSSGFVRSPDLHQPRLTSIDDSFVPIDVEGFMTARVRSVITHACVSVPDVIVASVVPSSPILRPIYVPHVANGESGVIWHGVARRSACS